MARHPRLLRRSGRFYVRARVPRDLVEVIGCKEIKQALGTSCPREALKLLRLRSAMIDARLAEALLKLRPRPVSTLSEAQVLQLALRWLHEAERRAALDHGSSVSRPDEAEELVEHLNADEAALADPQQDGWLASVQGDVDRLLGETGCTLDSSSPAYWRLTELVRRANLEAVRRARQRIFEPAAVGGFDRLFAEVSADRPPSQVQVIGLTIRELIDRYNSDPARAGLSRKTVDGYRVAFGALQELMGHDTPIRAVTRKHCREVRDLLAQLPPNASKRFKGLPLRRAAEIGRAQGLPPLSPTAANSYLTNLSALFNYAVREEYLDKNPAAGLRVAAPETAPEERKEPFTLEQLQRIFAAPLYTGCVDDEEGWSRPGERVIRRGRFWVPLVALWTGLRLNECCQLLVSDIEQIDGITVLWVRPSGDPTKRLKSRAARRFVPVHPELRRMGFLHHVDQVRRRGDSRLFPELQLGKNGYYSDPFQKWFSRFLAKSGAARPRTSFHSFRHNFRDALRAADISSERTRALGGWSDRDGAEAIYGSGHSARALYQEITKLSYSGLDLSHLHRPIIQSVARNRPEPLPPSSSETGPSATFDTRELASDAGEHPTIGNGRIRPRADPSRQNNAARLAVDQRGTGQ